ncbi:hypothetical protein [Streptomyces sp. DSM 118878]
MKRTVDRSGVGDGFEDGSEDGSGEDFGGFGDDCGGSPVGPCEAVPDGCREGGAFVPPEGEPLEGPAEPDALANASATAASSSGLLCAAPPPLSAPASCQAPSAPAAVPTATHAAVAAALRHFLMTPLCSIVS